MKLKPNEQIGYTFAALAVISFILVLFVPTVRATALFLEIICVFGMFTFLSWWGLTTFNDWVDKE